MKLKIFLLVILLGMSSTTFAQDAVVENLSSIEKRCLFLRDLQEKIDRTQEELQRSGTNADTALSLIASPMLQELETVKIPTTGRGNDFFQYYYARLLVLSGSRQKAQQIFAALADSETVAPEAVDGFFEVDPRDTKDVLQQHFVLLGKILPLSVFEESTRSLHQNPRPRIRYTAPADTPRIRESFLIEIANSFSEMRMSDEAAKAYLEAIYAYRSPSRILEWRGDSWLSPTTAPLWLKVSEIEWQRRNTGKAVDYLAKSIVFGSDSTKQDALKLLATWRQVGRSEKPTIAKPESVKLKRIAALYAEMGMQPRAIQLIDDFGPVIGAEANQLKQQYENQWLALMGRYCLGRSGKCWAYGQDVSRPEDRLQVRISPPLRPEALAEAAKTVRELAGKDNVEK